VGVGSGLIENTFEQIEFLWIALLDTAFRTVVKFCGTNQIFQVLSLVIKYLGPIGPEIGPEKIGFHP
jgi:hypothetical protein